MRVVADAGIPLLEETFAQWAELTRMPGPTINRAQLQHADALLVRSVTPVNAELLADSTVRFVGSATSGVDHVDQSFLQQAGIEFAHAHGCNAAAVADYVCSALALLGINLAKAEGLRVGVVGLGEVGGRVARRLRGLGCEVKAYDPFLDPSASQLLRPWPEVLHSDVLTLHVPLTHCGPYPTLHFLDAAQLQLLPEKLILINAARGAVIDNTALSNLLRHRPQWRTVLDVWENEPQLDESLLRQVEIATPHIAGHALEAKNRATTMIYHAFLNYFFSNKHADALVIEALAGVDSVPTLQLSPQSQLNSIVLDAYDIRADAQLLPALLQSAAAIDREFEHLRRHYRVRHEFSAFRMQSGLRVSSALIEKLKLLNFNV